MGRDKGPRVKLARHRGVGDQKNNCVLSCVGRVIPPLWEKVTSCGVESLGLTSRAALYIVLNL